MKREHRRVPERGGSQRKRVEIPGGTWDLFASWFSWPCPAWCVCVTFKTKNDPIKSLMPALFAVFLLHAPLLGDTALLSASPRPGLHSLASGTITQVLVVKAEGGRVKTLKTHFPYSGRVLPLSDG